MDKINVGVLLIATGNYHKFVEPFVLSAEKYFLPSIQKNYHVFGDQHCLDRVDCEWDKLPIIPHYVEHLPFPLPTLLRFHRFLGASLEFSQYSHLCYSDVDNIWVDEVRPEEVLSDLSATLHCGYIGGGTDFDMNPKSLAYMGGENHAGACYYGGGFILGTPKEYFTMARWCATRINEDFKNNVIAKWHDESFINKYLNTVRKPVRELTPSFHFAEYLHKNEEFKQKYPPKLLLLDKKHDEIRRIEYA